MNDLKENIIKEIKKIYDPEIPVNIYELGLIYNIKIEDKGVKVLTDPNAVMYLLGTEMDYKKEKFSSQFVFKNPNETERCGCGESFKV